MKTTNIALTGDTHGDLKSIEIRIRKAKELGCDKLIVLGDFSFVWDDYNQGSIDKLSEKADGVEILFIDGNHDNCDILLNGLGEFKSELKYGGEILRIRDNITYLKRGEIYTIDGVKILTFGGATSVNRLDRIEGVSWWKEEVPSEEEFKNALRNLEENNWEVDVILSHTCPYLYADKLVNDILKQWKMEDKTEFMLSEINERTKFKKWFFGHFHVDYNFGDKFECLYKAVRRLKI